MGEGIGTSQGGTVMMSSNGNVNERMGDLESMLRRIRLGDERDEPTAVDEVTDQVRRSLNITDANDIILKSIALQLINMDLNKQNCDDKNVNSGENSSDGPKEIELHETWSGETFSTEGTRSETKNPSSIQSCPTYTSTSPSSLEKGPSLSDVEDLECGRSPSPTASYGCDEKFAPKPKSTNDASRQRALPPASDQKCSFNNTTRSQSPLRSLFGRRKSNDSTAPSPKGASLKARNSVGNGNTTPRPPMSPYPPSSAASSLFNTSAPPTPNLSVLGLSTDTESKIKVDGDEEGIASKRCMDFSPVFTPTAGKTSPALTRPRSMSDDLFEDKPPLSRAPVQNGNRPSHAAPTQGADTTRRHSPLPQSMDVDLQARGERDRGRARTPNRMNPRLYAPNQNRSRSLPRSTSKDRSSSFRRFSPGRLFGRKAQSPVRQDNANHRSNVAESNFPHKLISPKRAYDDQRMPSKSAAPMSQASPELSKGPPNKTPAALAENNGTEFFTGKGKLRRKMSDPQDAVDFSTDDSLYSLDGEDTQNHNEPLFSVNLHVPSKWKPLSKAKRGTRKDKIRPRGDGAAGNGGAARTNYSALRTPENSQAGCAGNSAVSHQTNTAASELSPMDMDPDLGRDTPEGSSLNPPNAPTENGFQFSIGGPDTKRNGRRFPKKGVRTRIQQKNHHGPNTSVKSNPTSEQSVPMQQGDVAYNGGLGAGVAAPSIRPNPNPADVDNVRILGKISSMREEARRFHQGGNFSSSIRWYTEAIKMFFKVDPNSAPSDTVALLLLNRATGLLMIRAADAALSDCKTALEHVSELSPPQYHLTSENGPVLKAKLYNCMGRALLKKGDVQGADRGFAMAIETADKVMRLCQQVHSLEEQSRDSNILSQITADGTLGLTDVSQFQKVLEKIASYKLPDLQPARASLPDRRGYVEVLGQVNIALSAASCCVELHEKKIALLSNLRRWREVASHCERLAAANVLFDEVFTEDLYEKRPFLDLPAAKALTPDFFGDEKDGDFKISSYKSAQLRLSSQGAADAVLRIPMPLIPAYLRSLRLEERYPAAEAAIKVLNQYIQSKANTPQYDSLFIHFAWLPREASKVNRTKSCRERGDELFRTGEYGLAAAQYEACMKIDSEGLSTSYDTAATAGGRLHAVLHCNRAACLMAVREFNEAVQECTVALRIHPRYMKAMLRRARCYVRLERFEESLEEFKKWLDLVEEAKRSPESCSAFIVPCLFDGPLNVSNDDVTQVKAEMDEVQKTKERKENLAREDARTRFERQKFQEAFNNAHRRRDQWYNQQGVGGSRRWDSFNDGSGSRRSPKQKYKQESQQRTNTGPRRASQNGGSRAPRDFENNSGDLAGTHYEVLQLSQSAATADVKKAYRKLALKKHPDKNKDPGAAEAFHRLKLAYEVLNDPLTRRQYDAEIRWGRRF